ncbi:MAG: hypothetical protein ABI210_12230 [Abditibacteriaceae bacterium]
MSFPKDIIRRLGRNILRPYILFAGQFSKQPPRTLASSAILIFSFKGVFRLHIKRGASE